MAKLTRRRFAFWLGFGLFTLSEKFNLRSLDSLAAAAMRRTSSSGGSKATGVSSVVEAAPQEHWIIGENDTWRWFEREDYINGTWRLTGFTTPINKSTGKRKASSEVYLEDSMVPEEMLAANQKAATGAATSAAHGQSTAAPEEMELNLHLPTAAIRHRQGKPPSEWLRSLDAEEIRIWLDTIDVPNTGIRGMTAWTHLTRDHFFDPAHIEGLTITEQSKLHSAAHFGY
jgi:hypothetical protein